MALSAATPVKAAGPRTEIMRSLPMPIGDMPAASAADSPPDEPPGVRSSMMAAEFKELPLEVRIEVVKFGEANVDWLVKVLSLSQPGGSDAVKRRALAIYAAVQGAQLIARSHGDAAVYDAIIETYRESGLIP